MYLKPYGILTIEMFHIDLFCVYCSIILESLIKLRLGMQALQYLKYLSAGGAQCQKTNFDCIIKIFHRYIHLKRRMKHGNVEVKMWVPIYLTAK